MNESEALAIHRAIHDPSANQVKIRGQFYPIQTNKSKTRYCVVFGHKLMAQNMKKISPYTDMAKKGHLVSWLISSNPWGLIVDDKIEQRCDAFMSDEDYDRTFGQNSFYNNNGSDNNNSDQKKKLNGELKKPNSGTLERK